MKGPEKRIEGVIRKALEARGALTWKCHGGPMQSGGMPDLYVAHSKVHGWIEVKNESGRLTDRQRIICQRLEQRGVMAVVVRGFGDKLHIERWDGELWRMVRSCTPQELFDVLAGLSKG